jgi:hypothetical protein
MEVKRERSWKNLNNNVLSELDKDGKTFQVASF